MTSPFGDVLSSMGNYTRDMVGHSNVTFLHSLMIIVQLVPKLLGRKKRQSTPTQGQDANMCLSCLYKKESQLLISVNTNRNYIIFKAFAH
jgi:hypothetical protein